MNVQPTIWVLLPAYNGARYLPALLDSVLAQTHTEWRLLCRDDGSTDASASILAQYAQTQPQRVVLSQTPKGNLGARESFSRLMAEALALTANANPPVYFALADQDDIWAPHKLQKLLAALQTLEQTAPAQTPVLVHSDLRVVDQDGAPIAPSFMAYQGLNPQRQALSAQLISNTLTGCTALLNRPLLALSTPVHPDSVMHDWWISLVASAMGRRGFVPEALIDYRQHANNTIGAKAWQGGYQPHKGWLRLPQTIYHYMRVLIVMFNDEHNTNFQANARQAKAFAHQFALQLSAQDRWHLWLTRGLSIHFPPLQRVLFRMLRHS